MQVAALYANLFCEFLHYSEVIIGTIASQITSLTIVYSTIHSDADQRIHQSSESLAFVRGIHRGPVNSPHKWPVTRKMFPFDDVIMQLSYAYCLCQYEVHHKTFSKWSAYKIIYFFDTIRIYTDKCHFEVK